MRFRSAFRWLMLAYVALVLGLVAPAHQHVAARSLPGQTTLQAPPVVLETAQADPACEVCDWKGRTSLERGLPALAGPLLLPGRSLAPALARAPPVGAIASCRARAPPVLVA